MKDLQLNFTFPDQAMTKEQITNINNENLKLIIENLRILDENIKELQ